METITPHPPGFAVELQDPPPVRIATPSPDNGFLAGLFDRGTLTQAANVAALDRSMGARVNYSGARDDAATMLGEGVRALYASRVTGTSARAASVRLNDADDRHAATVVAKSVGAWANGATGGLSVEIEDAGAGKVRLIVTEDDVPVATSPATDDEQTLADWSASEDVVVSYVAVASRLPEVAAAVALAGGDDDRGNIRPADWAAAFARFDRRYGPGVVRACGVTDPAILALLHAHCESHNRVPFSETPNGVTKADALEQALELRAEMPAEKPRIGSLWASHAYVRPVAGEPERLVSWASVQAGIAARAYRTLGLAHPPFGVTNGGARTVTRLANEWAEADREELYLAGVNVAVDDGVTFATWGYKTLDLAELHADLHHRFVRMVLKWRLQEVAKRFVGPLINDRTQASFHSEINVVCKPLKDTGVLHDYAVDLASVNTPQTAAARERYALVSVRHTPTSDWVAVVIPILPI